MIVYKYVVADRVDVLENGNIRVTQPGALNYPFEAMPDFTEYMEQLKPRFIEQMKPPFESRTAEQRAKALAYFDTIPAEMLKITDGQFGFLSMTKQRNNLLDAGRITPTHTGASSWAWTPKACSSSRTAERRSTGYGKSLTQRKGTSCRGAACKACRVSRYTRRIRSCSTLKAPNGPTRKNSVSLPIRNTLTRHCLGRADMKSDSTSFPPECVREVILGYRMEKATREKIVEVMKRKYPHAEIFKAALSETEFAVEIVPFRDAP